VGLDKSAKSIVDFLAAYWLLLIKFGMTKYRKGPQRTTKDRKGPTKDRKGALRAKLQEIGTN